VSDMTSPVSAPQGTSWPAPRPPRTAGSTPSSRTFWSCVPHLRAGSAIVAVSIAGGVYGRGDHVHYAAAKAGVLGLCRSLAVELAPRGIRVNAVLPGLIETPQSPDPVNSLDQEGLQRAGADIPWGRVGQPETCRTKPPCSARWPRPRRYWAASTS
jgi:NAD(P)-dependent dehydrogenase (short-subunit alcohol dehydrogenase family)